MAKEMEKGIGKIKKFFEEFKKFITRGNVLDMAVGVIVGGAFTAIVNGLSNNILKPIINWLIALLLGKEGLSGAITMLSPAYKTTTDPNGIILEELDLAASIYIDWGAFISAIINFLLIAFVLFTIVKIMNGINEAAEKAAAGLITDEEKEIFKIRRELKIDKEEARGVLRARIAEAKAKQEEEARIAAEQAEAEAKRIEEKETANTRLLEEIRDLLKNK